MNRSQRNNNPLNLRFAQQKESTGEDESGFAIFPTPQAGWRAAYRQIKLDAMVSAVSVYALAGVMAKMEGYYS